MSSREWVGFGDVHPGISQSISVANMAGDTQAATILGGVALPNPSGAWKNSNGTAARTLEGRPSHDSLIPLCESPPCFYWHLAPWSLSRLIGHVCPCISAALRKISQRLSALSAVRDNASTVPPLFDRLVLFCVKCSSPVFNNSIAFLHTMQLKYFFHLNEV